MSDPYKDPVQVPQFRSKFGGFWTDLNNAAELIDGKRELGLINEKEAQLLLSFVQDGYVILPAAVDETLIDKLNEDVDRLVANPPAEAWVNCIEEGRGVTRQMVPEDKDAANKMLKLLDLYSFLPSARDVAFAAETMRFIKLVFERPVMAFQSLFFFNGSQQSIHRDTAFVRVSSPMELVASWTALEDIQPGSGELVYYPKSHQFPEFLFDGKYKWFYPGSTELDLFYQNLDEGARAEPAIRTKFAARKGDVLIWSADFAHGGSEIDDPNKTRRSVATHYCPSNAYPMYRHYEGANEVVKAGDGIFYCSAKKVYWKSG
jgi:ectoine hydroxylase-related dioxygenase (phytanoyl-CoA dioxygenase family)